MMIITRIILDICPFIGKGSFLIENVRNIVGLHDIDDVIIVW
jgi:hypothetical protein